MKQILLIFCLILFSIVTYSQISTLLNKDSSTIFLSQNNLYSFKALENNPKLAVNYSFNMTHTQSRFTLFNYAMLYDNYKHEYCFNINDNPLQPYKNFKSAVVAGSIKYLFLLFDK